MNIKEAIDLLDDYENLTLSGVNGIKAWLRAQLPYHAESKLVTQGEVSEHHHESFASIRVGQISGTMPLFGSKVMHQHYIELEISPAYLRSDEDRQERVVTGARSYIRVAMSEIQWARLLCRTNVGEGVPCTVRRFMQVSRAEPPPAETDSSLQTGRIQDVAKKVLDSLKRFIAKLRSANNDKQRPTLKQMSEWLREVESHVANMPANAEYLQTQLTEEMENRLAAVKTEIDLYVQNLIDRRAMAALLEQHPEMPALRITHKTEEGEDD